MFDTLRSESVKTLTKCDVADGIGKEIESWQRMMFSCRQACKVLSQEFSEPEFLNWGAGRGCHESLWDKVRGIKLKQE